jgi:hypothetical protein
MDDQLSKIEQYTVKVKFKLEFKKFVNIEKRRKRCMREKKVVVPKFKSTTIKKK